MELYIHIPFCRKKCNYCSFVSFTDMEAMFDRYSELIIQEAQNRIHEFTEPVRTVYIGGGTPSVLPAQVFTHLVRELDRLISFTEVTEFTSEANPGTVSSEWLDAAADAGINRLSLGMQAGQTHLLNVLGRIHCFDDVKQSVKLARNAGFDNINLDLIFGIPGQTITQWQETLDAALSLEPTHISAYGLIPEEETPLGRQILSHEIQLPEPDEERQMYDYTLNRISAYGMIQYEISNFAVGGFECRHNIGYWTQIPYVGLGVSAASMTGIKTGQSGMSYIRRTNPADLSEYEKTVSGKPVNVTVEHISPEQSRFETLMLGFRMNEGIEEKRFSKLHGLSIETCYGEKLNRLAGMNLLRKKGGRWMMTRRGFDIQNSILVELMDET